MSESKVRVHDIVQLKSPAEPIGMLAIVEKVGPEGQVLAGFVSATSTAVERGLLQIEAEGYDVVGRSRVTLQIFEVSDAMRNPVPIEVDDDDNREVAVDDYEPVEPDPTPVAGTEPAVDVATFEVVASAEHPDDCPVCAAFDAENPGEPTDATNDRDSIPPKPESEVA